MKNSLADRSSGGIICAALITIFFFSGPLHSQEDLVSLSVKKIAPPSSLLATDHKYDNGNSISLSWVPSIDDALMNNPIVAYKLYRSSNDTEPNLIAELPPGSSYFLDNGVSTDNSYSYSVSASTNAYEVLSNRTESITPQSEWINYNKKYLFLMVMIISGAIMYFIVSAKRGKELFVRKIAGLEAIDEAVGRATEMGRPIMYIPGIQDMDDVQTIASLTILGRITRTIAEYDSKIFMPVARSLVMTAARETIKASYQAASRPDSYSDDMVNYITDEQFGYVAHVNGLMVREKPATVFLLGAFFAESLILAETGNSIGAIQIAGTARPAQLPFFIAACDFTLIGEELFAASAYLSGEPMQLGSLKGQDVGKAIAMFFVLLGVLAATVSAAWDIELFNNLLDNLNELFS